MIAEVIVDVAAYPVDSAFDYDVPSHLEALIERGARVKVPFGNRPLLGFVTALKEESEVDPAKRKSIQALLDVEPVLTEELLDLAGWLKREVICFEIDALQAMLPAALRGKYKKELRRTGRGPALPENVQALFAQKRSIPFREDDSALPMKAIKRALKQGALELVTIVKQQTAVKTVPFVSVLPAIQSESLSFGRAKKQRELAEKLRPYAGQAIAKSILREEFGATQPVLDGLINKGLLRLESRETYRAIAGLPHAEAAAPLALMPAQQAAKTAIDQALQAGEHRVFLLHGVTGSGKTEVYLQTIRDVLASGRQAIMLVPEIALTPQMTDRFKARFGEQVAVLHSGLSSGEKYDEWRRIRRGEVQVAVGARSAVFAPFDDLGLIILDEEHESSYKQDDAPRYHARDVAIWRAARGGFPVVLGSATPSLESYARATRGVYSLLKLPERANERDLPAMELIDMREELRSGNRSMFSVALADAMRETAARGEQMVLFLNRRGYSSFVLCRDCGTVVQCPNCDISLTYHRAAEHLKCHYCGHHEPVPQLCPQCGSEHIRYFGTGTQKVEEELHKLLPGVRVLRMDVDTTRAKGAHERILKQFGAGEAQVLLGTQMIAKGLDFPNITLVGVLSADTSLHLPDFRAAEKTFQLLTQVGGRAGRHQLPGRVFIQTYMPEHYAIQAARTQQYEPFYREELAVRRQFGYPPYFFLALVQITHEDVLLAAEYARKAADFLQARLSPEALIMGPSASTIARLQNRYRYQCLIKYRREPQFHEHLQQLVRLYRTDWIKRGVALAIDLDPSTV